MCVVETLLPLLCVCEAHKCLVETLFPLFFLETKMSFTSCFTYVYTYTYVYSYSGYPICIFI